MSGADLRTWSFYDPLHDGRFVERTYSASDERNLAANTPPGLVAIEGVFDPLSQHVDLSSDAPRVLDWQPPRPSAEHEWDEATRRWRLTQAAAQAQASRSAAVSRIQELETKQQRYLRTAALGDEEGHRRLAAIETEIAALRLIAFPKE